MRILEKLFQVKEMTMQLAAYLVTRTLNKTTS